MCRLGQLSNFRSFPSLSCIFLPSRCYFFPFECSINQGCLNGLSLHSLSCTSAQSSQFGTCGMLINSPVSISPFKISCQISGFYDLRSFPASGSFPVSWFFTSGGQSIGVSASASVLPMNAQDWFPLGWTGWISLQSKGLSRVFSNTTVQKHQFFGTQPSLWSNSHTRTWLPLHFFI